MHIPLFHWIFGAPPPRFGRARPATPLQAGMLATILILVAASGVPARAEVTAPATPRGDAAAVRAPLLIGLLLFVAHNAELRHAIRERLSLWTTHASSRTWAWVMVVAPFLLGYGIALPVLASLGMLWPVLRKSQRAVWVLLFVTLLAVPFVADLFSRVALPMRPESTPAVVLPLPQQHW